ncbi:RICIN domain-containing protein [Streptomyces sp. NPDC047718]|uniref:RICIN domain-containing protein n=1 Tax=Streptomyces sp. NPDC047718 TaxID=3155479 RepID=UPI0033F4D60E
MSMAKRFGAAAGTLMVAVGLAVLPTSPASADAFMPLRAKHSGKCLEVADWSTSNGAVVRQWDCSGGANQQWTWGPNKSWVNKHSGKCLEIGDWSTSYGAQARQWDCSGGNNQGWEIPSADGGYAMYLQNRHSGLVLEIGGNNTANGVVASQWSNNGGNNQKWY